jgi:hypothetical protein
LPLFPATPGSRSHLRLQSLGWALLAGGGAAGLALPLGLEASLRSGGCGFFYGLLAFHLQRVDPDDSHLQAGLVGAVCGIRSLGASLPLDPALAQGIAAAGADHGAGVLSSLMMELIRGWLPLWLPLVGGALMLRGAQRRLPALRP